MEARELLAQQRILHLDIVTGRSSETSSQNGHLQKQSLQPFADELTKDGRRIKGKIQLFRFLELNLLATRLVFLGKGPPLLKGCMFTKKGTRVCRLGTWHWRHRNKVRIDLSDSRQANRVITFCFEVVSCRPSKAPLDLSLEVQAKRYRR